SAGRLVYRPLRQAHAGGRREARRVPLFGRFLQRRPALLGPGWRHAVPDGAVHPRSERHEVRGAAGLRHGRRLAAGDEGCLRHALRRRRPPTEDDVGRDPLPTGWTAESRDDPGALPRLRVVEAESVGRDPPADRRTLEKGPPGIRVSHPFAPKFPHGACETSLTPVDNWGLQPPKGSVWGLLHESN